MNPSFQDDIIVRLQRQEENLKEIEDFQALCVKMADHIKVRSNTEGPVVGQAVEPVEHPQEQFQPKQMMQ